MAALHLRRRVCPVGWRRRSGRRPGSLGWRGTPAAGVAGSWRPHNLAVSDLVVHEAVLSTKGFEGVRQRRRALFLYPERAVMGADASKGLGFVVGCLLLLLLLLLFIDICRVIDVEVDSGKWASG